MNLIPNTVWQGRRLAPGVGGDISGKKFNRPPKPQNLGGGRIIEHYYRLTATDVAILRSTILPKFNATLLD